MTIDSLEVVFYTCIFLLPGFIVKSVMDTIVKTENGISMYADPRKGTDAAELANYFEPDHKGDIFDFIPPQRTNQIFTPKKVVKDIVDRLEQENPGCFDDPDATFADLYMKSGMYVTEIVTRLYQSKRMKALYPDDAERLNHIFAKQVHGCAPTEIIYRICLRYILGFGDEIRIEKNNIRLCDTLEYAKNGTMDAEMRKLFEL